jgi:hypothetical protein
MGRKLEVLPLRVLYILPKLLRVLLSGFNTQNVKIPSPPPHSFYRPLVGFINFPQAMEVTIRRYIIKIENKLHTLFAK